MSNLKNKLWLGVGLCALMQAGDGGVITKAMAAPSIQLAQAAASEGGEAGENGGPVDVEANGAATYMFGLYEMEAVMRVGRALYEAERFDDALKQFRALEALFKGELGHDLEKLGFEREHVLVEAEQIPQSIEYKEGRESFLHVYDHVLRELDEHALGVEAVQRRDGVFNLEMTNALLQEAARLYASGDIVQQQAAVGLVWQVRDLLGRTATVFRQKDVKAFEKMVSYVDELASVLTLDKPFEAEPSRIYGLAAHVEFAMGKLR